MNKNRVLFGTVLLAAAASISSAAIAQNVAGTIQPEAPTQGLIFSLGDIRPELRGIVDNPARDEVSATVIRLYPGLYLRDEAVARERAQTANSAIADLASCYRSEHGLTGNEANEWARFVFDSTFSAEDGSSLSGSGRGLGGDGLADLGVDVPFKPNADDSDPADASASGPALGPEGAIPVGDDGEPLELIPFPETNEPTEYEIGEAGSIDGVEADADPEAWGPCADELGLYIAPLIVGGLIDSLGSEYASIAPDAQASASKIFSSFCSAEDGSVSGEECEARRVPLVEEIYPVHREVAAELIRLGLVD